MSFLKLSLLLLSAISYDVALGYSSPPHPEDRIIVTSIRERIWRHAAIPCTLFMKATTYLITIAESMVILGSLHDGADRTSDTISVILNVLGPARASQLTVPFVLGALLVIAGGVVRVRCYRELGPYFTFEQCIRKDHKLITRGPYAVVRHPAYTGLLMCILGSSIMNGSRGSWLRASGMLGMRWVRAASVCWGLIMAASVMTLFSRSREEDQFLSDKFGKEWENWAGRVRYKLVPFVY